MPDTTQPVFGNQLPAAKTFAGSADSIFEALAFFLGEPAVPEKLKDYSEHHAATYHFPDAFEGKSTKLRDTLINLILDKPDEWQTQVALPFVKIEGTTVEWDEMHFDVRLLQRVPYEGVSRMTTSLKRRHRDRVVRRGIGMIIESDFYRTEAGRRHFTMQLDSIRYCVQETCNFDVIFAYLTCGNYDFRYDMMRGLRPRRSVRTAMAHEVMMYGIVQKDGLGMDRAIEECKYRMSRYNITPNMLIVPPQLLLYLALGPDEKLKYIEGGDRAVTRFEEGVKGLEAKAYRGLGIFQSQPYDQNDESQALQLLQRSTQVGEFYRMMPPETWDKEYILPPAYMDIIIFDEEADKHTHITFEQAIKACCLSMNPDSKLFWMKIMFGGEDKYAKVKTDMADVRLKHYSTQAQVGADEAPKKAFDKWLKEKKKNPDGNDVDKTFEDEYNDCINCIINGIYMPVCIVIARPFIEHLTMSCIMTVSGSSTGATLFGPADMQISANTSVKTIEGHYTCHTKAVIHNNRNVLVMRDIMMAGYKAGGNCRWFGTPVTSNDASALKGKPEKVADGIQARLQFVDDASGEYGSLMAFACPFDKEKTSARDQVISITERLLPWEVGATSYPVKSYFPGGKEGFDAYNDAYGLSLIHYGEDIRSSENMDFIANGSTNNGLCFIGPHRRYNPWAQNFYELVPGQGHFGPDALPGDARWRRGESVSLKEARNAMVGYEVAAHSQLVMQKANIV